MACTLDVNKKRPHNEDGYSSDEYIKRYRKEKEEEEQESDGCRLLSLLCNSDIMSQTWVDTLGYKNATLINRKILKSTKRYIEENYRFAPNNYDDFTIYNPQSLLCQSREDGSGRINIPNTTVHLYFSNYFNSRVPSIPLSVKHISFGDHFNYSTDGLPSQTIKTLIMGNRFNQPVNKLPNSVTHLVLGEHFDQKIDNLPTSLEYLVIDVVSVGVNKSSSSTYKRLSIPEFSCKFNRSVDHLPDSLKYLSLMHEFNQSVDRLPPHLVSLQLGDFFDKSVECLPISLTSLSIGHDFNQTIKNLPSSLIKLSFGSSFNQPLDRLPEHIKILTLGSEFKQPLVTIPSSITHLKIDISNYLSRLTSNFNAYHISFFYNETPQYNLIPSSVTHLKLSWDMYTDQRISYWRECITHYLISWIPCSVTHVKIFKDKEWTIVVSNSSF